MNIEITKYSNLKPRIEKSKEKKFVGLRLLMNLSDNKTGELWKNFMPRRNEIANNITNDVFSISIYAPKYFEEFKPANEFEKWAAIEVKDFQFVPVGMETLTLPTGLYAVFEYKGMSIDNSIFEFIFREWLPNSGYFLDSRPHFEVLGEKYKNNDPDSEEEIWIPIKRR